MLAKLQSAVTLSLAVLSSTLSAKTFREDFSEGLAPERWKVSTWTAPRSSPINAAIFSASHVDVKDGVLRLKLTQVRNPNGSITSVGGEVMTTQRFGFGTYTLVMRASSDSPAPDLAGTAHSGSITGAGVYLNLSETEIDIEVEGLSARSALTQLTTWSDEQTSQQTKVKRGSSPHLDFHEYKMVWAPKAVRFFRDDELIAVHEKIVPTKPAQFLLNHWGTNDLKWGGTATTGVERFVYIKSFSFTPLDEN